MRLKLASHSISASITDYAPKVCVDQIDQPEFASVVCFGLKVDIQAQIQSQTTGNMVETKVTGRFAFSFRRQNQRQRTG